MASTNISSSSAFYKSIFENMLDGLAYCQMIFDTQGNPIDFIYIKVNKNFESMTGLKGVVGKRITQISPGITTSNPELFEVYGRVALTGKPERFETYITSLARWFFVSVYSPKKKFFVAVFQNITDRKQTEKNLENAKIAARNVLEDLGVEKSKVDIAKAKEEAILLSIGDGLLGTDEKGCITFMNKTAETLLGKNRKDVIGRVFSDAIPMEDEQGLPILIEKRPIHMALSDGTITTTTTTASPTRYYIRHDKTRFPVAIMVTPVVLEKKAIGTIEVFRDITLEKEIDKAKSEFVSLASHQLRTPLTTISWYTEMILKGDAGEVLPSQRKYLEEIYHGNRQMVELVNTLLDVSRIELGTLKIEVEPTRVVAVAQNVLDDQELTIAKKKLKIVPRFSADIPTLLTDPKLLRVILQNLLSNAVEYTPLEGTIGFSVSWDDKSNLSITISDTGCGIPMSQQDKIFTKLFRADNVREKDTEGTGLGLYIAKSIVENFHGKIWFESEERKGTTFYVTLPMSVAGQ